MLFDMHLHQGCLEVRHLDDLAERIPALQDGDLRALTAVAARGGSLAWISRSRRRRNCWAG